MSYRQVTETLKKVAKDYHEDMRFTSSYIKSTMMTARLGAFGVDARDFAPMLTLIGIEGDTRDAREQDIKDKLQILEQAFTSPNHEERKPYLDMIFDLLDNVDPAKIDMNNEEQVRRLVQCAMLGQTFGEKKKENPDYIKDRYPTEQVRALADAKDAYIMKTTAYVRTNLSKTVEPVREGGPKVSLAIPTGITVPSPINYISPEIFASSVAYSKLQRDRAQEAYDKNLTLPNNVYEVPVLDIMTESFGADYRDVPTYDANKISLLSQYFGFVIQENLLQVGQKNMQGLKEANLVLDTDSLYVDGIPFAEFKAANLPGSNLDNGDENLSIICNLLMDRNHQVDVVHAYRDGNNEMQYEAKTLKATISPEQERQYLLQNHSWFRLLFNWGPFRIESLQEKLDRAAANSGTTDRHERICENMKNRIETVLERKAEEARQSEIKDAEKQKALEATVNEKQHLRTAVENSVAKYGENSVIGILGQQVKNSYDDIMNGAMDGTQSARYEKMSLPLAKQVLFAQLCTERVSMGDKIGPLEQSLTGDTEEATREKIEAAAKNMAKDPVLKEAFFAMTGAVKGDYTKLGSDGTIQMINGGGYKALAAAYTEQKAAEHTQNKQAEAKQNEAQIQQQGVEKAPVNESAEAQASAQAMNPV